MTNSESHKFTASWDRTTWLATIAATAFTVLPPVIVSIIMLITPAPAWIRASIIAVVVALPAWIMWNVVRFSLRDYTLTPTDVIIRRRGGEVPIALANIAHVDVADGQEVFSHSVRSNASGGMFGFYGIYSSPGMGGRDFTAYATRISGPMVVLRLTKGDPVVLSPDDVDGFAGEVRARIAQGGSF